MFRKFDEKENVVMISKKILDKNLTPEALGCLVCISATHTDGETLKVQRLFDVFKMGTGKWQRISRELREAGIIKLERTHKGSRLTCIDY